MSEQPTMTAYALMGGEVAVRQLVTRFYELMDTLPEAAGIRQMHAADLTEANAKLYKFLSGWLGGPNLFIQEYGHPRLRQRHIGFAIGAAEITQWLMCMEQALAETTLAPVYREEIWQAISALAWHMGNQA